ncbi:MAG: hypothetical protein Q9205_005227 [Flavoplaca limonia]
MSLTTFEYFLRLPPAIRNEVYKLILISHDSPVGLGCRSFPMDPLRRHCKSKGIEINPSILRTCKAINQEATHYLYDSNCFYFLHEESDRGWLYQIGPQNANMVHDLSIESTMDSVAYTSLENVLKRARRLRRFHVFHGPYMPAKDQLRFLRIIQPWFKAHETLKLVVAPHQGILRREDAKRYICTHQKLFTFLASREDTVDPLDQCDMIDIDEEIRLSTRRGGGSLRRWTIGFSYLKKKKKRP